MGALPDPQMALTWSVRLCCVGILLQAAEVLTVSSELRDGHLLGWHGLASAPNRLRRMVQRLQGFPANVAIIVLRALAAFACLWLAGESRLAWVALSVLFVTQLYFNRVFSVIFANSDHLTLVCLAGFVIAAWPEASPTLRLVAMGFVCIQACLGYVASGVDKLFAPDWQSGSRMIYIFQDSSHRVPALGRWLAAQPWRGRVVSWSVILFELFFPVCLLLPPQGFGIIVGAGVVFHGSIAILMALPGFFWAFVATYPAMYVMRAWLTDVLG